MFVVLLRTIWLALAGISALGVLVWQSIAGNWLVGLVFSFLIMQLGEMYGPTPQERADFEEFMAERPQRQADQERENPRRRVAGNQLRENEE